MPTRQTWDATRSAWLSWTPKGEVLYATRRHSTLPNPQPVRLDSATHTRTIVPLAQASDGSFDPATAALFFGRLAFQGSHTRRYKGGTAQNLWRFDGAGKEAAALTADYQGTRKTPMSWKGRIYFAPDRDGVMNLWSMNEFGSDLKQHTKHRDYEVQSPSLSSGRIAYQQVPANGVGAASQLSRDGSVLRWDGLPSPDGNFIADHDKNLQLWIFDVAKKTQTKVADSAEGEFDDLQ